MKNLTKIIAITALSLSAGAVSAKTVDFYFGGDGGAAESHGFASNGVTVTVTASSFMGNARGYTQTVQDEAGNDVDGYITRSNNYDPNAWVGQFSNGLGVYNNTYSCNRGSATCTTDDYHTVDGSNWDDFLILPFSQDIQLTSVHFEYFGR